MSLIHKALKKAEGDDRPQVAEPAVEHFTGEKLGGLKSQLNPRVIILLCVALLSLIFMIYKRFIYKKPSLTQPPVAIAVTPSAVQPIAPVVTSESAMPSEVVEEGKKLFGQGKYDEALAKFLEAENKNPNDPVIYNNIGLIYKKKNDFAKAESFYKRAIQLKPNYPECLNNLGVLKTSSGDPLEAVIYLKRAIAADNTYADAYFNLGVLNDGEGNFKEAISNYKSFLQFTDTNDDSLIAKVKERIEELSE